MEAPQKSAKEFERRGVGSYKDSPIRDAME